MKLSNKTIGVVIALAGISLIGLSIIQVYNLESSLKTNKQIFLQKVDLISASLGEQIIEKTDFQDRLVKARGSSSFDFDSQLDPQIKKLINDLLVEYNLPVSYEYTIYKHKENSSAMFAYAFGNKKIGGDEFDLQCEVPAERDFGWTNLTCSRGYPDNYHMALFFPNLDSYILAQSSKAMIISILFILLLVGIIMYMVIIIRRQKKLSVIKNDFINNLTHEFKTPIASILLASGMLNKEYGELTDEKKENYLRLISQEGRHLEGQVDKVLQIAMIDSGNFSLEKKQLDLHELIKRVTDGMMMLIKKHGGNIKLNLKATRNKLTADETHLINILSNLMDNAIKYTKDSPNIEISTFDHEEGIQISIKDNGIGIGKEIQQYIFDKFYRAESGDVHNVKGFGLGLSYVKKIIEAHKGKIDLTSSINKGTEFRLIFPSG